MKNLGAAMAGGNGNRRENDFYATTPDIIFALLEPLRKEGWLGFMGDAWECACGDGAMSEILKLYFHDVISTDLIDRGYGEGGVDFLDEMRPRAPTVVTNPPFSLAEKFIRHAHAIGVEHMFLLLKSTYWHAASRIPLFRALPPAAVYPLTIRLDTTGQGRPTMEVSWFYWDFVSGDTLTLYERPLSRVEPPMEFYL